MAPSKLEWFTVPSSESSIKGNPKPETLSKKCVISRYKPIHVENKENVLRVGQPGFSQLSGSTLFPEHGEVKLGLLGLPPC